MLIEIKPDIFNGSDFRSLNYLIQIITYGDRYSLWIELNQVKDTELYKRLDLDDKAIIEVEYNKFITQQTPQTNPDYCITYHNTNNTSFNFDEAIRFLIQPVSIILENSLNDAPFLKALATFFDSTRDKKVQKHLDNDWLQFENAGGCTNVENFIKGKLQSFDALPKDNHQYLRCFVLLDSDKTYPQAPLKPAYTNLQAFLAPRNIAFHILEKRCMENYMPDEVFDYIAERLLQRWINVYKTLTAEQKDYLNLSKGFPKKKTDGTLRTLRSELDIPILNLFQSVSDTNFAILDEGFKLPNFKSEFPELFTHHQTHKTTLLARTQHQQNPNELQGILDKIITLL